MLKEIRKYYGIQQTTLSEDLKISRSQLSMTESHQRSLPAHILVILAPLHVAISHPPTKQKDEKLNQALSSQEEELSKLIGQVRKDNEYELILLGKKLAAMKEDQARCINILEMIDSLRAAAKPKAKSLLDSIERQARNTQKKTRKDLQLKLELQIHSMKAELDFLSAL